MKQIDKCWNYIKKETPTILAITGSIGTGATAYLAAKNEAEYQNQRFDYYLEHGMFPEECSLNREDGKKLIAIHLKHHISTFISGSLTIASILYGNSAGKKQNAALTAMNVGLGTMIARNKEAETKVIESLPEERKGRVSREEIQDYLIQEAYNNGRTYYVELGDFFSDETNELLWLEAYPANKIFAVAKKDVGSLEWYINTALKAEGHVSYGEIFDYLNIDTNISPYFYDEDINDWIYLYGFIKEEDEELDVEVYSRPVTVDEGVTVTALSFSATPTSIQL